MKPQKAPGLDDLQSECFMHLHNLCLTWLTKLFSTYLGRKKVREVWKFLKLVAILKPNKHANELKSYRAISLLYILS